jgi:hypothetical protein
MQISEDEKLKQRIDFVERTEDTVGGRVVQLLPALGLNFGPSTAVVRVAMFYI